MAEDTGIVAECCYVDGEDCMRTISIGAQGFEELRRNNYFYVDKTSFIREWWDSGSVVTLITRPRRFGKTLNMDMLNCFFSNRYAGRGDLFEGLEIWQEERFRALQGTYPVISLSFADIKQSTYADARLSVIITIRNLLRRYELLWSDDSAEEVKRRSYLHLDLNASDAEVARSLQQLSEYLYYRYQKKVLILLDEYDTPLQEAYVDGYWDQMSGFIRELFNSTFKTNPSMERALLTGITRISKESIFSELNNLKVITTRSERFQTSFGFTEEEVLAALKEYGLYDQRDQVKDWYDGFTFGSYSDIYNPWSITNYLDERKFDTYWANTSSNSLISYLIRTGNADVKDAMQRLMEGGCIETALVEEIVYSSLDSGPEALWGLLLASGYLRLVSFRAGEDYNAADVYTLQLTNGEVRRMFAGMVRQWFAPAGTANDSFVAAMMCGDENAMNVYMRDIMLMTFSSFDSGTKPSVSSLPEKFYHGFVLGLLVREGSRYRVKSNRESGLGRYDVCLFPRNVFDPGIVMEFKVQDRQTGETSLEDTAAAALRQIREKEYVSELRDAGAKEIYCYGFAFCGKEVLIRKG